MLLEGSKGKPAEASGDGGKCRTAGRHVKIRACGVRQMNSNLISALYWRNKLAKLYLSCRSIPSQSDNNKRGFSIFCEVYTSRER